VVKFKGNSLGGHAKARDTGHTPQIV